MTFTCKQGLQNETLYNGNLQLEEKDLQNETLV